MKFKIIHSTTYLFSGDVFLEPHYLRFRPKTRPFIEVTDFLMSVESKPNGRLVSEDEEQNLIDFCWFEGVTNKLCIEAHTSLETKPYNPFNFIIYPDSFNTIPFTYSEHQYQLLYAPLQKMALSQELINYADAILKESSFNTIAFCTNLTAKLHKDYTVEYRESGPPLSPNETLLSKKGSCRDLSWLQINLLRHYGLAARFVSGYFYFEMDKPMYELHAWVEVFMPGSGWIGLDPSHGILTGNTHFAIASSAIPENTMPVSGGIRGSATSQMLTTLRISKE